MGKTVKDDDKNHTIFGTMIFAKIDFVFLLYLIQCGKIFDFCHRMSRKIN